MSSLNEIAFNILNLLRGGRSDHDEHYDLDQIKYNIKYYRNLFIRRDEQRFGFREEPLEQELKLITLKKISNAKYSAGEDDVLRSTVDIPNLLRLKNRQALTYVGPENRETSYPIIQYNEARFQSYNKWTSGGTRIFTQNNRIYAIGGLAENIHDSSTSDTFKVVVRGIFEDPEDVIEFNTGDFYDHDDEFPSLPDDYIQRITQGITSGELRLMGQTQSDVNLNQRNDIKGQQSN